MQKIETILKTETQYKKNKYSNKLRSVIIQLIITLLIVAINLLEYIKALTNNILNYLY
ncbi:hypothetical protein CIRMBP1316_02067 [Enterococcus cecorum]|nr:hypothetical protein CIRMBP1316_02067 [Enterococcus cecorum]